MAPFGTDETIRRVVEQYSAMLLHLACTRLDSTADAEVMVFRGTSSNTRHAAAGPRSREG